jgi:copper transport protein
MRLGIAGAFGAVALVVSSGPATAHALLVHAEPAPGSTVQTPVRSVSLDFTEVIDSSVSKFTVRASSGGSLVSAVPTIHGQTVVIPTNIGRAGTIVVSWVVAGGDGHPVQGQYLFTAGAPTGKFAGSVFAEGNAGSSSLWWWIKAGRFVEVALLYLVLGILLIRVLVLRDLGPDDPTAARTYRVLIGAGLALGALAPPLFLLYAARLHQASGGSTMSLLFSSLGRPWIAKVVVWEGFALAAVFFAGGRPAPGDRHDRILLGLAALGAAAYVSNTHAAAASPQPWWGAVMWSHVMVTALWAGGVGALIFIILPAAGSDRGELAIQRFSTVMTLMVAGIVLSGVPMLLKLAGSWQRAWCTSFGVTAGFKLAVVAVALTLGVVNNRLVHLMRQRTRRGGTRTLAVTHRLMGIEALALVVVLGLSASLGETALPPAIRGALLPGETQSSVRSGLLSGGCKSTGLHSSLRSVMVTDAPSTAIQV